MAKVKTEQKTGAAAVSKVMSAREKVVRERLVEVKDTIETGYLEMSELLSEAYHKEFHLNWGFGTFQEYCNTELDLNYRKGMYLLEIWDKVKTLDLPKQRVAKLGWTKMKDIAAVITKKNAEGLLKKAESMNSRELNDYVKTMRSTSHGGAGGSRETERKSSFKFSLGESEARIVEDAITEAKRLFETDSLGLAVEGICTEWMQSKGSHPEVTALEDFIPYLEKRYPVKITFKMVEKKKVKAEAAKGQEALAEVEGKGKKKGKGKKGKEEKVEAPDEDLIGEDADGDIDIEDALKE